MFVDDSFSDIAPMQLRSTTNAALTCCKGWHNVICPSDGKDGLHNPHKRHIMIWLEYESIAEIIHLPTLSSGGVTIDRG